MRRRHPAGRCRWNRRGRLRRDFGVRRCGRRSLHDLDLKEEKFARPETAVAFGLPPFIIVTTAAWLYVQFAADWHLRALFYGIAPAIVALIIKACWNLGRRTLRADRLAWTFAIIACAITVIVQKELAVMFIAAGLRGALLFAPPAPKPRMNAIVLFVPGTIAKLFLFFFKTGLLIFGSGLVIVPFLKTQVVDQYHWLTNRQFSRLRRNRYDLARPGGHHRHLRRLPAQRIPPPPSASSRRPCSSPSSPRRSSSAITSTRAWPASSAGSV